MVRVKVCGMMSRRDVESCVAAGADALGFIFAAGPRCLSIDAAEQLTKAMPPFVTSVGVFAGNDARFIQAASKRCRLDVLQFSGGEAPEFCGAFGRPTITVVHASPALRQIGENERPLPERRALTAARAVAVMVDARVNASPGGTGIRVPNDVAAKLCAQSPLPFILAGGLTPDSVAAAIAAVRPWGVDVRSGVERDGRKAHQLVERFVREAKGSQTYGAVEFIRPLGVIS
jgi:phosphoribosylanthranilate isomerase